MLMPPYEQRFSGKKMILDTDRIDTTAAVNLRGRWEAEVGR